METKIFEKGFNISKRISDDFFKLGELLIGNSSMEDYLKLKNEIKVLIYSEKDIYDKLSEEEIKEFLDSIIETVNDPNNSMDSYDYRRYIYNLYVRSKEDSFDYAVRSGLTAMKNDLDIYGMINIETMRRLYEYISNTDASDNKDKAFKTSLFKVFYMILPPNLAFYDYSEKEGLTYDFNIDKMPKQDIKKKLSLKPDFDMTLLLIKIKNDMNELVAFSKDDTSLKTVFSMLYNVCRIELSLELLKDSDIKAIDEYYSAISVGANNVGHEAIKRILKNRK